MLLYFFCSVCTIQSDTINFQPFLSSFAIFHAFNDLFWELNDLEIKKHYKRTLKKLKFGMVSSFHPHSMCKKVERVTAKTGCTSFTNWTISFEVFRFLTKLNSSVTKTFHFFKIITTPYFLCIQYASFKATPSTFNRLCLHLLFVLRTKWPGNWKALQMNSEKVETWHGIIISPT